eukprot:282960-Rhodomonas_salina.2
MQTWRIGPEDCRTFLSISLIFGGAEPLFREANVKSEEADAITAETDSLDTARTGTERRRRNDGEFPRRGAAQTRQDAKADDTASQHTERHIVHT